MKMRKLLLTAATVAAFAAGLGLSVLPASAQKRTLVVTLLGGQTIVVTVDVPPGTPLDKIKIPNVALPIVGVSEPNPPAPVLSTATTTPTTTAPTGTTTNPKGGIRDHGAGTITTPTTTTPTTTTPTTPTVPTAPTTPAAPKRKGDSSQSRSSSGKKAAKAPKAHAKPQGSGPAKPKVKQGQAGVPDPTNPTFSLAEPGPAAIGIPNFFIDRFRIPPFLLPIYQAAGIEYGVPWQVLAAINEIETDYGRNLNVSTAGAVGWMQFLPSTFKRWGVDANGDGKKDPYNPVDAIFSAARYLKAAGADKNVKKSIFAYNHADWYVQSVLLRARLIGGLPAGLIGSLTGLTQGHFPVAAKAKYADAVDPAKASRRVKSGNAAVPVGSDAARRSINIFAKKNAPVIAVQDGRITKVGVSKRIGRYMILQDVYGNSYTYGELGKVSRYYAIPKPKNVSSAEIRNELKLPKKDPKPSAPATAGIQRAKAAPQKAAVAPKPLRVVPQVQATKERLFAHPARPVAMAHGGKRQLALTPQFTTFKNYFSVALGLKRKDVELKRLKVGSQVIAGTILGRVGKREAALAPHLEFEVRPAGKGAPRVDPKPILDGWKLLEATAIYRASGKNPFFGADAKNPSVGQVLLMSKESLERRVLADPKVKIYDCGRRDIQGGLIDRRVLATIEFLVASGLDPTISALECGHSFLTTSGNVSEHSSGNAVDIAAVNGIPILGHQGPGTITDITIRRLLTLQGTMKPHQIISLMTFRGADNTLSLPDHYNHIHVGFHPLFGENKKLGKQLAAILKPGQWIKLIDRLNSIPNPKVSPKPSKYSIDSSKND
jgi:Transglycosylase SLT domain